MKRLSKEDPEITLGQTSKTIRTVKIIKVTKITRVDKMVHKANKGTVDQLRESLLERIKIDHFIFNFARYIRQLYNT